MRVAVLADIHGNLTALRSVQADLRLQSPDLVLVAGDLALGGSSPCDVVDLVRAEGWHCVYGNADEAVFRPESWSEFLLTVPPLGRIADAVDALAVATREMLGSERLEWMNGLPMQIDFPGGAVVHASPHDVWRSPSMASPDEEFARVYDPLQADLVIFGHLHVPFVRRLAGLTVVNTGGVGKSNDRDTRASYVLVTDGFVEHRRIEYDLNLEANRLKESGLPHSDWLIREMMTAGFVAP